MPVVTTYRCDLTGCSVTAESADGQLPPGWCEVRTNEAGITRTVLHDRGHLAQWCGASSAPDVTEARARAVLAARQPFNPRANRGLPGAGQPGPTVKQ